MAEEEEVALETEKEHPVKEKENQEAWCPRGLENEVFQKEVNPGNSLVNQWLGLNIFTALAWVQSLVGELISHELSNAGDARDVGSIPGWGKYFGGGHGNPLQCSCLRNPMDREA